MIPRRDIGEKGDNVKTSHENVSLESMSMSMFKSSWTKEKESVMMKAFVVRGVRVGMKNLASL